MRIVQATSGDADRLAGFAGRTFVDAYGDTNVPAHVSDYVGRAFDPEVVFDELADPGNVFLTASDGDGLCAYVKLCLGKGTDEIDAVDAGTPVHLERIYVDRRHQSSGVGGALLDAAIRTARDRGARWMWLAVWEKNARAQRFYARSGFSVAGNTSFMLGPERQQDLIMARRLD